MTSGKPSKVAPSNVTLRTGYLVARLERVIHHRMTECLLPHGINVPQYTALSILGRRSNLSNAQLARRTYVTPQGMGQVLTQLTAAGLITRQPSRSHGRVLEITLTARGRRVLNACDADIDRFEKTMLATLSADGRRQMLHGLLSCVRALQGGLNSVGEMEL